MEQTAEKSEISIHEARIFSVLSAAASRWMTSREIAKMANVADRTARAHLLKLERLGLLDTAEVFPAHRYRLAAKNRNGSYLRRLTVALSIFGIKQ